MNEAIKIGTRIKKCREEAGLTQEELGTALGLNKSTIQRYETGKVEKIKRPVLEAIAAELRVDFGYLALEKDAALNVPAASDGIERLPSGKIHMIPVFETVSAGFGAYADNRVVDYIPLYIANDSDVDDTMCIKVSGDSMYPKIEDGDIIVVRRQPCADDNGQIAVVLIDGEEGVVKKINSGRGFVELISINPMYPPRRFEGSETDRVAVLGIVRQIIKNV